MIKKKTACKILIARIRNKLMSSLYLSAAK